MDDVRGSRNTTEAAPSAADYSFRRLRATRDEFGSRAFFNGNVYYEFSGPMVIGSGTAATIGRVAAGTDHQRSSNVSQLRSDPSSFFGTQRMQHQQGVTPTGVWTQIRQSVHRSCVPTGGQQQSLLGPPPGAPPPSPCYYPASLMQPQQAPPFGFGGPGPYPPMPPQGAPVVPINGGGVPSARVARPLNAYAPPFVPNAARALVRPSAHPVAQLAWGGVGGPSLRPGLLGAAPPSAAALAAQGMPGRMVGGGRRLPHPGGGIRPSSLAPEVPSRRRRLGSQNNQHENQEERFPGNANNMAQLAHGHFPLAMPPVVRPGGRMVASRRRMLTSILNRLQPTDRMPALVHHGAYPVFTPSPLVRRPLGRELSELWGIGRGWPYVTARGTIALRLNGHIMVEITCDDAIRVVNYEHNILLTLDHRGLCAALVHPTGRMHQNNARVEVVIYEPDGNHKFAKLWYKGVSFTSEYCSLVYLVDEGGTRTTADRFSPQLHAPAFATSSVFLQGSLHSCARAFEDCYTILQRKYEYFKDRNGVDVWVFGGIRVTQTEDGVVMVYRDTRDEGQLVKRRLKTSSRNGCAYLSTPMVHATASLGPNPHLFVRRSEKRVHKDENCLIIRNGSHSAGFDEKGRLKVF